jgi:hypothetical protein
MPGNAAASGGAASASPKAAKTEVVEWAWDERHAGSNVRLGTSVTLKDDDGVPFAKGVVDEEPRFETDKMATVKVLSLRCPQSSWDEKQRARLETETDLMTVQELCSAVSQETPGGSSENTLFKDTVDQEFLKMVQVVVQDRTSGPRYLEDGNTCISLQDATEAAQNDYPLVFDPYQAVKNYTNDATSVSMIGTEGNKYPYSLAVFVDKDQSSTYGTEEENAMSWAKKFSHEDSSFDLTTLEGGMQLASHMRTRIAAKHNSLMEIEQKKFVDLTQGKPNKLRVRVKDFVSPVAVPGFKLAIWKDGATGDAGAPAPADKHELAAGVLIQVRKAASTKDEQEHWLPAKVVAIGPYDDGSGSGNALLDKEILITYELDKGIFGDAPEAVGVTNKVKVEKILPQGDGRSSYAVTFVGAKKAFGDIMLREGELSYDLAPPKKVDGMFPHEGCFLDVALTDRANPRHADEQIGRCRIPLVACDKLRVTVNRADLRTASGTVSKYDAQFDPCVKVRIYRSVVDSQNNVSLVLLDEQKHTGFNVQGNNQPNWDETLEFMVPRYDAQQLRQIDKAHQNSRDGKLLQERTAGVLGQMFVECDVCQGDETSEGSDLAFIGSTQVPICRRDYSSDTKVGAAADGDAEGDLFPEARVTFDGDGGRREGTIVRNNGPTCRVRVDRGEGEEESEEITIHSDKLKAEGGSVMNFIRGGRRTLEMNCQLDGNATQAGMLKSSVPGDLKGSAGSVTLTFEYQQVETLTRSFEEKQDPTSGDDEEAVAATSNELEVWNNQADNSLWETAAKPGRQHISKVGGDPGARRLHNAMVNVEWMHYHEDLGLPPYSSLTNKFRRRKPAEVPISIILVGSSVDAPGDVGAIYTLSDVLQIDPADRLLRIEAMDPRRSKNTTYTPEGTTNVWLTGHHLALFELIRSSMKRGSSGGGFMKFKIMQNLSSSLVVTVIEGRNLKNMDAGLLENPCGYTCDSDAAIVKDLSDPYVEVSLLQKGVAMDGYIQRTPTITNDLNPRWNKCLHVQLEPEATGRDSGETPHLGISGFNAMGVHIEAEIMQGTGQREKVLVDGWGTGSRQKFNIPVGPNGTAANRYVKFMRVEPRIDRLRLTFYKKAGGERFGEAEFDLSNRKEFPLNDQGVTTKGLSSNGLTKCVAYIVDKRGKLGEITFHVGYEMGGDRMEFENILDFDNQLDYKLKVQVKDKDNHAVFGRDDIIGSIGGDGISLAAVDPDGIRTYERKFELVDENEDPTGSFIKLGIKWAAGRGSAITKGSNCVFELPYDLRKIEIAGVDGDYGNADEAIIKGTNAFRKDLAMCVGGQQTVRANVPLRSAGSEAKDSRNAMVQTMYVPGDMVECNYLSVASNNRANGATPGGMHFRAKVLADGLGDDGMYPSVSAHMMRPAAKHGQPSAAFDLKKQYNVGEAVVINYRNRYPARYVDAKVVTVCEGLAGAEICVPKSTGTQRGMEWSHAARAVNRRIEEHGGKAVDVPTGNTKYVVHPDMLGESVEKAHASVKNALKNRNYTVMQRCDMTNVNSSDALDTDDVIANVINHVLNTVLKTIYDHSKDPPASGLYDVKLISRPTVDDLRGTDGTYRLQYEPSPNPTDKLDCFDKPAQVMAYNSAKPGTHPKPTQLFQRVQKFLSEHSDPSWRKDAAWKGLDSKGGKVEKAPPRNNQKAGGNCSTLDEFLEQYDANDYDIDKINASLIGHLESNRSGELDANKKSSNSKWSTSWKCISGLKAVKSNSIDVHIKKAWNLRRTDTLGAEGSDPYVRLTLVRVQDVNQASSADGPAKQFLQEVEAGVPLATLIKGTSRKPGLQVQRLTDKNVYRTRHIKTSKHPDWTSSQRDWPQIITLQLPREKDVPRTELCVVVEIWDYDNPKFRLLQAETDELSCTAAIPLDASIFAENSSPTLPGANERDQPNDKFRCVKVEANSTHGETVSISSPLRQGGAGWDAQALVNPKWEMITSATKPQDIGLEMHQPKEARQSGGKGNVGADKQFKSCLQLSLSDNSLLRDETCADQSVQEAVVNWYKKFFPNDPNFQSADSIRAWLKREFKNVTRAKIRLQEMRVNEVLRRNFKLNREELASKPDAGCDLVSERPLEGWVDEAVSTQCLRTASGGTAHVFEVELNWSLLGCGVGVVGENFSRYNGYMCDDVDGYCLWWDGSAFSKTNQTLEFLREPEDDTPLGSGGEAGVQLQLSTLNPGDRVRMDVNMQEQSVTFYRHDPAQPGKRMQKLAKINNLPKVVYPAVSFCDGTTCSSARLLKKAQ